MYLISPLFPQGLPFNIILGLAVMMLFYTYISYIKNDFISRAYLGAQALLCFYHYNYSQEQFILFEIFLLVNLLISHLLLEKEKTTIN